MNIKIKIFYLFNFKTGNELIEYDKLLQKFVDKLCDDGHIFISINTIPLGGSDRNLRTEITYKENHTRNVLVEKTK